MAYLLPKDFQSLTSFVARMADAVIDAQRALDRRSLEIFEVMSDREQGCELPGVEGKRSLLELGFVPPFLHFSECRFNARMSIVITKSSVGKVTGPSLPGLGGGGIPGLGSIPGLGMLGSAAGPLSDSKYSYPTNESCEISTRLVARPAPKVLLDRLKPKPPDGQAG